MSWKLIERHRQLLASETQVRNSKRGAGLSVCLVFPNSYRAAMSNLGFQAVYAQLNDMADVLCERAFLPDRSDLEEYRRSGTRLLSLESQRPLTDFDIVALSVSFESDYFNIPVIFKLAGIQPFSADRPAAMPLVMAGGAALFLNPEPVAEFLDLACLGEAETLLGPLIAEILAGEGLGRAKLLLKLAALPGIYIPSLYRPLYQQERLLALENLPPAPPQVQRVWDPEPDRLVSTTEVLTDGTEFGDMYLIEVSRGCPHGCRFCAAGFIYLPYRYRSLQVLKQAVDQGLQQRDKIGLVGAAVSDHPQFGELCSYIISQGGKVSVSSLRLDRLDDDMIVALRESGHKTLALAPEGGSQRLRDLVRKKVTEAQILSACDRLISHDILNLKLYFIIGLPTETFADLEELVELVRKIRERVISAARSNKRLGEVVLSVNPFVPKPFTPFQWCGMEDQKVLEKKVKFLTRAFAGLSNIRLNVESLREAYLQGLLSRGDRRLAALLVRSGETGNWKSAARELAMNTDLLVYRNIPLEELLPWDFIASGNRAQLTNEYRKAFNQSSA
jgi:radical SAM superfamily enzyme YgiQ (UPF0313 family)